MDKIVIRNIRQEDNAELAKIVRDTLAEFKANRPGTVFYDDATDHLFESFETKRANYLVLVLNGKIAGGAGIYPTSGLPADTCELVKMYLLPFARGKGFGRKLIENCITGAQKFGYEKMYLETMPELISAIDMYERFGFKYLSNSIGNSGHSGCTIWMMKEL